MASGDLKDELNCSICLDFYTDPVSLKCGHNFCRSCIVGVLDTQDGSGGYSCPDCRAEYPERPALEKNRKLENIVERFLSTRPDMETRIFCTYCTKSPVPAVRSCLQCENSLCDDHLMAHNKTMDHVLTEPTGFFGNKKCSIHKKVLEYYCPQDAACLCVSCCLVGKHRGHQVELLDEASEKKKEKLRKYLDEVNSQKEEIQTRVQNLQNNKQNIQKKASDKRENVSKLFMDIKRQLEMAEKKALSEISGQEEKIVSQISHQIQKLERKTDELSRKMRHVEEMCQVTDPIRLLQEGDVTVQSHGGDGDTGGDGGEIKSEDDLDLELVSGQGDGHVSDTKVQDGGTDPISILQEADQGASHSDKSMEKGGEASVSELHDKAEDPDEEAQDLDEEAEDLYEEAEDPDEEAEGPDEEAEDLDEEAEDPDEEAEDPDEEAQDLDEVLISLTLHRSMRDIVTSVKSQLGFHVPDILLDEDTAYKYVEISEDLKTATNSEEAPEKPESPGRFLYYPQVLSRCVLSSGKHYWEVEWNKKGICYIGVSYPSIARDGAESGSGDNDKSWSLILEDEEYSVIYNEVEETLHSEPTCPMIGVFLDYEAGRLSFYELGDPIRHLYSFTASFTEPLHVIFYMDNGASVTIRS